jgi:hypothetical protein
VVYASLFTGPAVWCCSAVASSGDAFIYWGLRFLGYDAALLGDRFPTFIRKAVPSPSRVRTLNPRWYNFFFFQNFGNCSLSDEASNLRRTHFSSTVTWRPRDSSLICCSNATDTNRTVDFELQKQFYHYVTLSYLTTLSTITVPASYVVTSRFRISAKTVAVLTKVFRILFSTSKFKCPESNYVQATTASFN